MSELEIVESRVHTFTLQAIFDGDPRAIDAFILEYSPLFCRVVQNILGGQTWGNRQEDLVQDIFLALFEDKKEPYKALRAYRPDGGSTLKSFLWRFAQFRVYDRLRSHGFGQKAMILLPADELGRLADADTMGLLQRDRREDCIALIQVAKHALSESDLRFFKEAFVDDRPTAELAQSWNTTDGAIHQRRSRVRRAVIQAFNSALLDRKK